MGPVLALLSCLKWFYLRPRIMDWDVKNWVSERGSLPGLLHQVLWVNINKGCDASTSKAQPSQELYYLFSSHSWTNKTFSSPCKGKHSSVIPKREDTRVISFLFDIMSLGNHAHLIFLTQHYLLLSLTYSFYRTVYEAVKLSSITFRNILFLRVTYSVGLKGHTGKDLIAAAILAQAD